MEEQLKQVTNIISKLAAQNPYITKEQIAKAKSMYNGDMRPIDEIRAELEAYSEEIMMQGQKREADKVRPEMRPEKTTPVPTPFPMKPFGTRYDPNEHIESHTAQTAPVEPTPAVYDDNIQVVPTHNPEGEVLDSLRVELPGEDKQRELQNMIDEALGDHEPKENNSSYEQGTVQTKTPAKVLVKENTNQNTNDGDSSSSSEAGYGNITALLSLTIICSIVTIIIAFFTILAN